MPTFLLFFYVLSVTACCKLDAYLASMSILCLYVHLPLRGKQPL
jgi:hypothetical protein